MSKKKSIFRLISTNVSQKPHFRCKLRSSRRTNPEHTYCRVATCAHFHAYTKLEWKLNLVEFSWVDPSLYAVDFMLFRKDSSNQNIITQVNFLSSVFCFSKTKIFVAKTYFDD